MRCLRRPRVLPPTLRPGGAGAKKAEQHRLARESDPTIDLDFPDHWNNSDVRGALYAMQGWVCAYCNADLFHDRGDVDHFRPKRGSRDRSHAGYWWLAYEFSNYFMSCQRCNRQLKLEAFPIEPGSQRTEYSTRAALPDERRLLADPAVDPIESWLKVDCIKSGCFIRTLPRAGGDTPGVLRADATIAFFVLNDVPLRQGRIRAYEEAVRRHREYRDDPTPERREILRRMASRYMPHGMTVRAYVEQYAPEVRLPSPEEELSWFLIDLERFLTLAEENLESDHGVEACDRLIQDILWALAVLWKDPPEGTRSLIEGWLEAKGLRTLVEPKYRQLN